MKILFVSSEVAPFARMGGLADVVGSLPQALRKLGHEVRIILPLYRAVRQSALPLHKGRKSVQVVLGGGTHKALLRQSIRDGITVYFLENEEFFDRDGIYANQGQDYSDNAVRFGFFCKATLELLRRMDFRPDVLHLHDWPSALIAPLLRTEFDKDPFFAPMATLLTIHDLSYQGLFAPRDVAPLKLPQELFSAEYCEYYDQFSFLKGGILHADMLNTVSDNYRRQIQQQDSGMGFGEILSRRCNDLHGINNGLEPKSWDPALDTSLAAPYNASALAGKKLCKRSLQQLCDLEPRKDRALLTMIAPNEPGKGLDLLEQGWEELLKRPVQLSLLITGDEDCGPRWREKARPWQGQVCILSNPDENLIRQAVAGSDMLLMPGRHDPGGLNQLIALRYGSVPLVQRSAAGADTIIDPTQNSRKANGFNFKEPDPDSFIEATDRALSFFATRHIWRRIMKRGMVQDVSWDSSAKQYQDLYRRAIQKRRLGSDFTARNPLP